MMKTLPTYAIPLSAMALAWVSFTLPADVQGAARSAESAVDTGLIRLAQEDGEDAPANPTAAQGAGPGWAVNCKSDATEKGLQCRLSQTVVTRQGNQVLTEVTFVFPEDNKEMEVIVQLPLGLFLPGGATMQVDDNTPQRLTFRACDRRGCFARAPISPDMLTTLQKGKQLQVKFQNLAENPIDVPLSLDGFGDAYSKIKG